MTVYAIIVWDYDGTIYKVVGPFDHAGDAAKWADENIRGKAMHYTVTELESQL